MTKTVGSEAFRAAFRRLLDSRGHGAQAEIADALSLHRSAINDILNGRRGTSSAMQARIASRFGLSLGEMLRIGENLLEGRVVFPWRDQLDNLTREQQLLKIIELTNAQVGYSQDNLAFIRLTSKFLKGDKTPAELYTAYLKLIRSRTA